MAAIVHDDKEPCDAERVNVALADNGPIQRFGRGKDWCATALLISQSKVGEVEVDLIVLSRHEKIGSFDIIVAVALEREEMNGLDGCDKKLCQLVWRLKP